MAVKQSGIDNTITSYVLVGNLINKFKLSVKFFLCSKVSIYVNDTSARLTI